MKRKLIWVCASIPAIFTLVFIGKAYAAGNLDAYIEALKYGLKGLESYLNFIVELFKAV